MKRETLPDQAKQEALQTLHKIVKNIRRVIVGKDAVIRNLILALATGRHVLVEDVPGVGKTTLIKSLARSLNLSFRRIQFTPDLLPSDITGTSVLDPDTSDFRFRPGPVFHNVVLADEINRASPKTQLASKRRCSNELFRSSARARSWQLLC
ncbi:MAG: AAA family ATPase, partial [Bacillota bacterium]